MTFIELRIGWFDYGNACGVQAALLGFGVHVSRGMRGGWAVGIFSEWSFFHHYKSWHLPRRKATQ